jgi:hypothetical protein
LLLRAKLLFIATIIAAAESLAAFSWSRAIVSAKLAHQTEGLVGRVTQGPPSQFWSDEHEFGWKTLASRASYLVRAEFSADRPARRGDFALTHTNGISVSGISAV